MSLSSKKICILTSVHSPFDPRIFHKQAKSLVKAGYEVVLIAPHTRDEFVGKVKIQAVPKPRNRIERMLLTAWLMFRKSLGEKADMYHFHDSELIPVGLLLKIFGKRVIYDVHENYAESVMSKHYLPKVSRRFIALIFNILEKTASKVFDCVITATDHIQGKFRDINSITIKNFPIIKDLNTIESMERNGNKPFIIIYTGSLASERGITQIIQACDLSNSNNIYLWLLGWFSPKSYESSVRNLKGFRRVNYVGRVRFEELPEYYNQADVGIVCCQPGPNYIDSMPTKLFEYMAAELPVIASNFPLRKKIVEGNKCGICVDPTNPETIAGAIKYLYDNSEIRKEMGKNGRRAVLEKYNWEKEGEKLLDIYSRLLGEKENKECSQQ